LKFLILKQNNDDDALHLVAVSGGVCFGAYI